MNGVLIGTIRASPITKHTKIEKGTPKSMERQGKTADTW